MEVQSRNNAAIFNDQENNVVRGKAGAIPVKRGGLGLHVLGEVNSNIQVQRDAAIKKNALLNLDNDKKTRATNKSNYSHVQSKVDTGLATKTCVVPSARAPLRREESTAALAVRAARSNVLRDVSNKSSDTKDARRELKKITNKFIANKENKIIIHRDDVKTKKVPKPVPPPILVEDPLVKLNELNISKEATNEEPSLPIDIEDIDSKDRNDPLLMAVYIKDIYRYLQELEDKYPVEKHHLNNQVDVTGQMRKTLMDWLVEVQSQFNLLLETFHLTVRIIDRYLQLVPNVRRNKLQLIGVTAMFIASKYEEIYPPEVRDFVYITDKAYTKAEVFQCEREIMSKLGFALSMPIPLSFLRRYIKAAHGTSKNYHLSKYLVDLSLLEYSMAHYRPSEIAASAICLSMYVLSDKKLEDVWTPTLAYYSGYTLQHIAPIVKEMATVVTGLENSKYKAVSKKYSDKSLAMVSGLPQLRGEAIRDLLKCEL